MQVQEIFERVEVGLVDGALWQKYHVDAVDFLTGCDQHAVNEV
jgi:hypothetical protein